jgi:hypothetical protein
MVWISPAKVADFDRPILTRSTLFQFVGAKEGRMKLQWTKYSRAELKHRWDKFRYRRHRRVAWIPTFVTYTDPIRPGWRIRRRIYWFEIFDCHFHLGSWSRYPHRRGTPTLKELVHSGEPAPYV